MKFRHVFLQIAFILVVHVYALSHLYHRFDWFDAPMHFLGGFAMSCLAMAILRATGFRVETHARFVSWHAVFYWAMILGFLAMVSIAWEWHEFVLDAIRKVDYAAVTEVRKHQPGVGDTMMDFFMDFLGGVFAILFFGRTYGTRHGRSS